MENRIRLHYILLFFCMLALSCTRQDDLTEEMGYVTLGNIQLDETTLDEVHSRVGADNDFYFEIYSNGKLCEGCKFAPSEPLPEKIALAPGKYTYKLYNEEYNTYLSWSNDNKGAPVYYYEGEFIIGSGTTIIIEAKVSMIVFGVRLALSDGYESISTAHSLNLTVGDRTLSVQNGEIAYFPLLETSTLKYQFNMTNVDNEQFSQEEKIFDGILESNTIYEVHVDLGGAISLPVK